MKKILQQQFYIFLTIFSVFLGAFFMAPSTVEACEVELGPGTRFRTNFGTSGLLPDGFFQDENPPFVYVDIDTVNCSETDSITLTIFGLEANNTLNWVQPGNIAVADNITDYPISLASADENGRLTVALTAGNELCYSFNDDYDCLIFASIKNNTNTTILALLGDLLGNLSYQDATNFAEQFGNQAVANTGATDQTGSSCTAWGTDTAYYFQQTLGGCGIGFYFNGYGNYFDEQLFTYYNNHPNSNQQFVDVGAIDAEWRVALPKLYFNCEQATYCDQDILWKVVPNPILEYGMNHGGDQGITLVNPFSDSYEETYTPLAPLPFEGLNGGESGDLGDYFAAIFRTLIVILVILAVLMLVFYGFAHVVVDSISKKDTYREKTWNILYSLLLALGAWLLLNTISPNLASDLKLTLPTVSLDGDAESVSVNPVTTDTGTITGFQLPQDMNIFCEGSGGSSAVPSIIDSFENKVTYRWGGKGGDLPQGQSFPQSPNEANGSPYMCNNNGQNTPCRSFCPDDSICLDCSGFVNHVRQCAGLSIYSGTLSMTQSGDAIEINMNELANDGESILINNVQYVFEPGDILAYNGHVVIYYGDGYIAESLGDLNSIKNSNRNIKKSRLAQYKNRTKITHLIKTNP